MNGLETLNRFVWGLPSIVLILGVGIYVTISTRFAQIRFLPRAIKMLFKRDSPNSEKTDKPTSYQALCTALAATVGTGNLAGVAGAIALGGPGAVFWCWITGLLGMATSYTECYLSLKFRETRTDGSFCGGPMYLLKSRLHTTKTARFYGCLLLISAFCVGCSTQSRAGSV